MDRLIIMAAPGVVSEEATGLAVVEALSREEPTLTWADLIEQLAADGYDVAPLLLLGDGMAGWLTDIKRAASRVGGVVSDVSTWTSERLIALGRTIGRTGFEATGVGAWVEGIGDQVRGIMRLFRLEQRTGIPSALGNYWPVLLVIAVILVWRAFK